MFSPEGSVVLALDTATSHIAAALARVSQPEESREVDKKPNPVIELLAEGDCEAHRRANTRLLSVVDEMLSEANLNPEDIDIIVCGQGPGSFTGVRIAVATAKGLAEGLNVPLFGVSTLTAQAWSAWQSGVRGTLLVAGDAMRKEIYPALFELSDSKPYVSRRSSRQTVNKAAAIIPMLGKSLAQSEAQVTGDALFKYQKDFEQAGLTHFAEKALWYPTGKGLIDAFVNAPALQMSGDPSELLPTYTRLSDAEENERIKLGREDSNLKTGVSDDLAHTQITLRPMSINDIDAVAQLEHVAFDQRYECWTKSMFKDELRQIDRIWWVAHNQEDIVGFCGAQIVVDDVQILDMAVAPKYRRRGIAQRLVQRVTYDGLMLGALTASLEVRASNTAALELYKHLGFVEQGQRPRYYGGSESAIIMSAKLPIKVSTADKKAEKPSDSKSNQSDHAALGGSSESVLQPKLDLDAVRPIILAIETSCDETAVSILDKNMRRLAEVVASQIDFHARFGGVVPEIASRKHTETIVEVFRTALSQAAEKTGHANFSIDDVDALAVTQGPGLVGALVVGVAFAKGLSFASDKPLIGVNHLEGHIYANLLEEPTLKPPFITLLVSGGHTMLVHVADWGTYEILGETLDDAVGEAFDKVSKALGMGYPGGPIISRLAETGDPTAIEFPRAMLHSHDYQFSLSGLKTAVMTYIQSENAAGRPVNAHDVAASFQAAVIDVQVAKTVEAVEEFGVSDFCMGGGVAANKALREALTSALEPKGIRVTVPAPKSCTDNATMIALAAFSDYQKGNFLTLESDADVSLSLNRE